MTLSGNRKILLKGMYHQRIENKNSKFSKYNRLNHVGNDQEITRDTNEEYILERIQLLYGKK